MFVSALAGESPDLCDFMWLATPYETMRDVSAVDFRIPSASAVIGVDRRSKLFVPAL